MPSIAKEFSKGLLKENPVFRLMLGLCPTLATSTSATDALGMGMSMTFVLVCSNIVISLIRNLIPDKIRIPCFIVVIASFVTVVDLFLKGFMYDLHKSLGLFIPLIVVNCIILGRAEAFASKNGLLLSIVDGLGMGLGFTLALMSLGVVREFIGGGSLFKVPLLGAGYPGVIVLILPPGAFLTIGLLMGLLNKMEKAKGEAR